MRMKNIVLIGISGSGKTAVGERLARRLSREFIDLDSFISNREESSIEQIFNERGEEGFRLAETEAAKVAAGRKNAVIACGGGVVLKKTNMEALSRNGIVIFMNRPIKHILENVDLKDRPLLKDIPEKLYALYRDREVLYDKYADFEVNCAEGRDKTLEQLIRISGLEQSKKKLAVIGDPISQSLSPDIHIPALRPFVKSISYERAEVKKGSLSRWIPEAGRVALDGFNVTMPHKEDIIGFLDRIDEEAQEAGSVNTVVKRDGSLWGYNTDGDGFAGAVESIGESFYGSAVTIIGSGGAAATIAMKAAKKGAAEIHITARNQDKAELICQKIKNSYKTRCKVHPFNFQDNGDARWDSRIIVNTTPLGMKGMGNNFRRFDFLDNVNKDALICDLIYSPLKTGLLSEAEKRGLKTLWGITMLIEQALRADCLYLGAIIKREKAYKRIIENLKGKVEGI